MKAGNYGSQSPRYDTTKATNTNPVVIQAASGETVTVADLAFGSYGDATVKGANYITIKDITDNGGLDVIGCGATPNWSEWYLRQVVMV